MKRKFAAVAATALLVAGGIAGSTQAASAAEYGINMVDVCHYEVSSLASPVIIAPGNATSWRCVVGASYYGVDLTLWCQFWYSNGSAYAHYSNFNDPYSWTCHV